MTRPFQLKPRTSTRTTELTSTAAVPGEKVGAINVGDCVRCDAVQFGSTLSVVEARISAKLDRDGRVEFPRGSEDGERLGTLNVSHTGGWNDFVSASAPNDAADGVDALYFVFLGDGAKALLDIDHFEFR